MAASPLLFLLMQSYLVYQAALDVTSDTEQHVVRTHICLVCCPSGPLLLAVVAAYCDHAPCGLCLVECGYTCWNLSRAGTVPRAVHCLWDQITLL